MSKWSVAPGGKPQSREESKRKKLASRESARKALASKEGKRGKKTNPTKDATDGLEDMGLPPVAEKASIITEDVYLGSIPANSEEIVPV